MAKTNREKLGVVVPGLDDTFRALNKLPKEVQRAVRVAAREVAEDEADRIRDAGKGAGRQSRLVAEQIRTRSDRVPAILAGGSKKLSPSRKIHRSRTEKTKSGRGKLVKPAAGDVFFGAEFGGGKKHSRSGKPTGSTLQFGPHTGRQGRWFWPQLREDAPRMIAQYGEAVEEVFAEFAQGGD